MSRLQGNKMNKLFAARFPLIWRGQSQTLARSFPLTGFQESVHVAEKGTSALRLHAMGLKTSQQRSLLHIKNKKHLTSREVRLFMQLSIRIHELYNCGRFVFVSVMFLILNIFLILFFVCINIVEAHSREWRAIHPTPSLSSWIQWTWNGFSGHVNAGNSVRQSNSAGITSF